MQLQIPENQIKTKTENPFAKKQNQVAGAARFCKIVIISALKSDFLAGFL